MDVLDEELGLAAPLPDRSRFWLRRAGRRVVVFANRVTDVEVSQTS